MKTQNINKNEKKARGRPATRGSQLWMELNSSNQVIILKILIYTLELTNLY